MAQVAVRAARGEGFRSRIRSATQLIRMALDGCASLCHRSRSRGDMSAAMSAAQIGRETGVKC
jgi:hypothetical protein